MDLSSKHIHNTVQDLQKPAPCIKTGFTKLDELMLGLRLGKVCVVAGRPAMGKSTYAMNVAYNVALTTPVLFFSVEMSGPDLLARCLSSVSLVPTRRLRTSQIDEVEQSRIKSATENIERTKLWIVDDPRQTPGKIRDKIDWFRSKLGTNDSDYFDKPFMVIIDFLQLLHADKPTTSKAFDLECIVHELQEMFKHLPATLILVSQVNRETEGRDSHWPRLSDLKGSGAIEESADYVIFPYRPDYYSGDNDGNYVDTGQAWLIVAKNRFGEVGKVPVAFLSDISSFKNTTGDGKLELWQETEIPF